MDTARENLVIGYYPGVTRAPGLKSPPGRKDVLQKWLLKVAQRHGDPNAVALATEYPSDFLDIILKKRGVVFTLVDGELTIYSLYGKPQVPAQIIKVLADHGINQNTPAGWHQRPDADGDQVLAGDVVSGLPPRPSSAPTDITVDPPPASSFESLAVEIVDELIG